MGAQGIRHRISRLGRIPRPQNEKEVFMRLPQQSAPVQRNRFYRAETAKPAGILPQGCSPGSTLCSCAFTNTCCPTSVTCGCPFGFAKCE